MALEWRDDPEAAQLAAEVGRFADKAADLRASPDPTLAFEWERRIGEALRRARERLGTSQSDVVAELIAWGLDMHQTTLAKLEAGKRPIRLAELFALSTLYGMTPGAVMLDAGSAIEVGDDIDRRIAEADAERAEIESEFVIYSSAVFKLIAAKANTKAALSQVLNTASASGRRRWAERDGERQEEA